MNLEMIEQEAESYFSLYSPAHRIVQYSIEEVEAFAKHCVDKALRANDKHSKLTKEQAAAKQHWCGMDGAIAFHLIDRHADGWDDVGTMMNSWLEANKTQPPEAA